MATFLQLAQALRQEAGVPGTGPTSVINQSGELKKLIEWVARAWTEIQNLRRDWHFSWAEFSSAWSAGQTSRTAAQLNITDLARWRTDGFAIYPTGTPDQKQPLPYMDYGAFQTMFERRAAPTSYPTYITIAPDGSLRVNCVPNISFQLTGKYYRTPQVLTADGDVPRLPADFHDMILYKALTYYAAHEEAPAVFQDARDRYLDWKQRADIHLAPEVSIGAGALGD